MLSNRQGHRAHVATHSYSFSLSLSLSLTHSLSLSLLVVESAEPSGVASRGREANERVGSRVFGSPVGAECTGLPSARPPGEAGPPRWGPGMAAAAAARIVCVCVSSTSRTAFFRRACQSAALPAHPGRLRLHGVSRAHAFNLP
jgi:hypothetical protein